MLETRVGDVAQRTRDFGYVVYRLRIVVSRRDFVVFEVGEYRHDVLLALLRHVVQFVRLLDDLAQHLAVLLEYRNHRAVVNLRGETHRVRYLGYALSDDAVGVVGYDVFRFSRCGSRLVLLDVAAHEHPAAEQRHAHYGDVAAVHQRERYAECYQECAEARNEPPRNDGEYARDAVYRAFASPCLVGERRTHRHHEAYVGGRERQF